MKRIALLLCTLTVLPTQAAAARHYIDLDGDGVADVAGYYVQNDGSPNEIAVQYLASSNAEVFLTEFGTSDERAVPADYDGDGTTDLAVVGVNEASQLRWRFKLSSQDGDESELIFGESSDLVLAGCFFDEDQKSDPALIRGGTLYYQQSSTAELGELALPYASELFSCADLNGDGRDELVLVRAEERRRKNRTSVVASIIAINPESGEQTVVKSLRYKLAALHAADLDGDGTDEVGFLRSAAAGYGSVYFVVNGSLLRKRTAKFEEITFGPLTSGSAAYGAIARRRASEIYDSYASLLDASPAVQTALDRADYVLPAVQLLSLASEVTTIEGCDELHDPYDGANGFLWKPISDTTGNAVVLFPSNLTGIKQVKFVKDGLEIEEPFYSGNANGGRDHYRSRKRASSFPKNFLVRGMHSSKVHCWLIEEPNRRID